LSCSGGQAKVLWLFSRSVAELCGPKLFKDGTRAMTWREKKLDMALNLWASATRGYEVLVDLTQHVKRRI
jgi:hypothetical protein